MATRNTKTPKEAESINSESSEAPPAEPTRLEALLKTSTAAKLSGAYHDAAGFIKSQIGKRLENSELEQEGRDQQLLGKFHKLVGALRGIRDAALSKLDRARSESQALYREQGGKLLKSAIELIDTVKKNLLK
jgi:uncharacterized protein YjbJ (UPF0337 family)